MSNQSNDQLDTRQADKAMEVRVGVTKTIWGCATGMLGICIPLVGITENTLIPCVVVVSAALGTAAVWMGKGVGQANVAQPTVTQEQLKALEERLANVEAIDLLEKRLAEKAQLAFDNQTVLPQALETKPTRAMGIEN